MIPKIIHRTVQRNTNELIDTCFDRMKHFHPDWDIKTWYDEDEYPYVGKYLDKCIAGAFRADLIRLDVVYRYGGIYLDSDIYLLKSLDGLLDNEFFCAGELVKTYGNLAFGATPYHPLVKKLIDVAIEELPQMSISTSLYTYSTEPCAWGPYVHTKALFFEKDVVRLTQETFQPYTLVDASEEIPLMRPLLDKPSKKAPPLTDQTYGVHLNNWSWNPDKSWDSRK